MRAYLRGLGVWQYVEENRVPPLLRQNPTLNQILQHEDEVVKALKALSYIHAAISDSVFTRIMACESAHEAWMKLKTEFQGSDKTRQMQVFNLRKEFELLRMKDTDKVKEYADRVMNIVNQIRLLGEEMEEKRVVEKVMVTLPDKFEAKISSLEDTWDMSQISVTELSNAVQAVEQRKAYKEEEIAGEKALVAAQKSKPGEGGMKNQQTDKKDRNKKNYKRKGKDLISFHLVLIVRRPITLKIFVGFVQELSAEDKSDVSVEAEDVWLVDSGCTHHMTADLKSFKDLDTSYSSKVRIGDGRLVDVKGKRAVAVQTSSGIKVISDVLYVLEISQSLLSVGQLLDKNYTLVFKDRNCEISDPIGVKKFLVKMNKRSFPLNWKTTEFESCLSHVEETFLWHKRFGHTNLKTLKLLQSKNLVVDMPLVTENDSVCEACQFGKFSQAPFPVDQAWRASTKLELIHTDVCGPISTSSYGGSKYFLLFIDDFSRYCWVYFLKQKSEVFSKFQQFKAFVETQTDSKIKILRSDNGTEYTSIQFKEYLQKAGIHHQLTVPYTPQQNGVSERKNRYLMNMARCLLFEKNLPKELWAEAVNTAVYLQNRLSTKALDGKTPFEAWFGVKPSVAHLKVFGSICYSFIPEAKRSKLDSKAEKGVFVGYSSESKGHRVLNPFTHQVYVSRSIKVDEGSEWDWSKMEPAELAQKQQTNLQDQQTIFEDLIQQNGVPTVDDEDFDIDEYVVRGTRSLDEIYERCNIASVEPTQVSEALEIREWRAAMEEELKMIKKNETWTLVPRPVDKQVIGTKWIFKVKLNSDGSINKYKARLVVKGYAQLQGVDYTETFAPVARFDTIRLILALAASEGWQVFQLDVKSAFLNGFLEEQVYIEQPEGFNDGSNQVCLLKKALYGLKQAPRAWYSRIDSYLLDLGFKRSLNETTLYVKHQSNDVVVVSLYVDDLLVTGSNLKLIEEFKFKMQQVFEMNDLGKMCYFLGMEISQSDKGFFVSQKKYAWELLKKFDFSKCKPVSIPATHGEKLKKNDDSQLADALIYRSMIGSLLYLSITRPDIMFATSILSRFMNSPSEIHLVAAKRVLRYIRGTIDYGLFYRISTKVKLLGFLIVIGLGQLRT
ncbi:retrovirus-related Pol polyprotein from transposon TNT 1-94 [Hevea brasiliensis]|uniref:retrovirus-related Pol polyprotein from transposon TNT 1-94 n=1 Tax=Hevea brasiliensis TaxID=3981 RepID=UPI0025CEA0C4|nr:retrovirus-related Pol polyprotein from transposon TNT 1-94 [Hevea brasiliensis]